MLKDTMAPCEATVCDPVPIEKRYVAANTLDRHHDSFITNLAFLTFTIASIIFLALARIFGQSTLFTFFSYFSLQ